MIILCKNCFCDHITDACECFAGNVPVEPHDYVADNDSIEMCDECAGSRWPNESHEKHCSLHEDDTDKRIEKSTNRKRNKREQRFKNKQAKRQKKVLDKLAHEVINWKP
jgi:hypothetical protein